MLFVGRGRGESVVYRDRGQVGHHLGELSKVTVPCNG